MRGECSGLECPYENEYWHLALDTLSSLERVLESWSMLGRNGKKEQNNERKAHWSCYLCVLKSFEYIEMQIYELLKCCTSISSFPSVECEESHNCQALLLTWGGSSLGLNPNANCYR